MESSIASNCSESVKTTLDALRAAYVTRDWLLPALIPLLNLLMTTILSSDPAVVE